ncbi:MAG: hypothetical protein U0930_23675 [Pirellulales bacterium]
MPLQLDVDEDADGTMLGQIDQTGDKDKRLASTSLNSNSKSTGERIFVNA